MKTSKLYTEEQVKYAIQVAFDVEPPCKVKDILRDLTPIELPTDEEIEERAERNISPFSFIDGANWVLSKIETAHGKGEENDAR